MLLWLATAVGILIVVPAAVVCFVSLRALKPPHRKEDPVPVSAKQEPFDVVVDGKQVRGVLYLPPNPRGVVLLMHGWGSTAAHMSNWAAFLADGGWASVAIDARGHGTSDSLNTVAMPTLAEDIRVAVNALAARSDLASLPRMVLGHSMGGAAVLRALSLGLPVRGAVISSAFSRVGVLTDHVLKNNYLPPRLFGRLVKWTWDLWLGVDTAELEPAESIRNCRVPLLLTHGSQDEVISQKELGKLVSVAPEGTQVVDVKGAAHSNLYEFESYRQVVLKFFEELHQPTGSAEAG